MERTKREEDGDGRLDYRTLHLHAPGYDVFLEGKLMPTRPTLLPSELPSLSPDKAISFIQRQLDRLEEIEALRHDDPKIKAWESTTRDILDKTFGKPHAQTHQKTNAVLHADGGQQRIGMSQG